MHAATIPRFLHLYFWVCRLKLAIATINSYWIVHDLRVKAKRKRMIYIILITLLSCNRNYATIKKKVTATAAF